MTDLQKFREALEQIARHRPDMHHGDAQVMHAVACRALGVPRLCDCCEGNVEVHEEGCMLDPKALNDERPAPQL